MPMTKERSGTTPSLRTRSQRSLTGPSFDSWLRLERLPRGGPAGVGMQDISWRCLQRPLAETGARGTVHIPQRRSICTDKCSGVNHRRRVEPAGLQVWQKHPHSILFLHFQASFIQAFLHLSVATEPNIVHHLFCKYVKKMLRQ